MIPQILIKIREGIAGSVLRTLSNYVLPKRKVPVTIILGAARGISMDLHLRSEKYYWLGIHEHKVQKFIAEVVRPGSIFYDLGANVGFYSLLAARIIGPSGRCFAFEPVPDNIGRLERNIKLNQMEQIHIIPVAVSDEIGTAIFRFGPDYSAGAITDDISPQTTKDCISIPTTTIDHFVLNDGNPPPHIIKMDIEGGEGRAIAGMMKVLRRFQPYIVCELSGGKSASQVWNILKDMGYRICDIDRNPVEDTPEYMDIIAFPPEET